MLLLAALPAELFTMVLYYISTEDIATLSSMPELEKIIRDQVCYIYDSEEDNTEAFPHLQRQRLQNSTHLYLNKRYTIVIAELHNLLKNTKWTKSMASVHGDLRVTEKKTTAFTWSHHHEYTEYFNTVMPLFQSITFEKLTNVELHKVLLDAGPVRFPAAQKMSLTSCDAPDKCQLKFGLPCLSTIYVLYKFGKLSRAFDFGEMHKLTNLSLTYIKDMDTLPIIYSKSLLELYAGGLGTMIKFFPDVHLPSLKCLDLEGMSALKAMVSCIFDRIDEEGSVLSSSLQELNVSKTDAPGDLNFLLERFPSVSEELSFVSCHGNHLRNVVASSNLVNILILLPEDYQGDFAIDNTCSFPCLKRFELVSHSPGSIPCRIDPFSAPLLANFIIHSHALHLDTFVADYPLLEDLQLWCGVKHLKVESGAQLQCISLSSRGYREPTLESVSFSCSLPKLEGINGSNVPFLKDFLKVDAPLLDRDDYLIPEVCETSVPHRGSWHWNAPNDTEEDNIEERVI